MKKSIIPMSDIGPILPKEYLMDQAKDIYYHGLPPGLYTGVEPLDNLFRLDTGRVCVVTGIPNDGKSEFVDFVVTTLNKRYGYNVAYFSPENQPVSFHISKLVSKFTNKPFCTNCISEEELINTAAYITDHFFFCNYEKVKTTDQILSCARALIQGRDVKILVIDAFNKIESECGDGDALQFISCFLDKLCAFAIKEDILVFLVAHPRKMDSGRQPGPYDINGSANFFNKSDFVISVQRNRRDEEDTSVTIGVGKVKFKNYGKQGSIELLYDEASGNYYSEEFDALAFLDNENVEPNGYTPDDFVIPPVSKNEDPLNVEVSVYAGTSDNIGEIQNLKDFLMTDKYKTIAEAIRKGSTPEERHDIKTKFKHSIPCATVSASFSKRETGSLLRPTGLLCVDVDYKDNKDVIQSVPKILRNLPYVTYMSKSISGDGYFAIVKIDNPSNIKQHFLAIEKDMKDMGITIDASCKDATRLRFATYDDNAYYNPQATTYYKVWEGEEQSQSSIAQARPQFFQSATMQPNEALDKRIEIIKTLGLSIPDDYATWFQLGMSLSTLGEEGRQYFHTLSAMSPKYSPYDCDAQYDEILERYGASNEFTLGTAVHILNEVINKSTTNTHE